MTAFNPLGVITDPDVLSATVKLTSETRASTSEVFIDTTTTPKSIQLFIDAANVLTEDGVTIKALYSFLKDQWKTNADLIKFPFPMTPITDEQFEFTNGWNLDKATTSGAASQTTPQLLRTGGWAVKNTAGNDTERWVCLISLGTLGSTDQVYYQQVDKLTTDNTTNIVLTGTVNQAVQFYRDDDGDGVTNEGSDYNYSQFMKLFVREWQKTYASSSLTDIGVTTLSYQAYRFPLTNTSDSKIVSLGVSEQVASGNVLNVSTASWSTSVATITTTQGHQFTTGDLIDVKGIVSSGQPTYTYNGTFEIASTPAYNQFTYAYAAGNPGTYTSSGNVSADPFNNMSITWYAEPVYETGFQTPSAANYTVVIDADVDGSASPNPSVEEIYAFIQAQLRLTTNINSGNVSQGTSVKIGKVVPEKLRFVGDDLYTLGQSTIYEGVHIRNYNDTDINKLHFTGYGAGNVGEVRISSINRSATGNVTVITTQPHGFESNYAATISGVTGATTSFNVTTGNITVANTTAFYFIQSGTTESGTVALDSFARFNIPQIISISRSANVITATTLTNHGLAAGNIVTVSGVTAANTSAFNGTFPVASTTFGNTFTYIQLGDNESGTVSSSSKAAPAEFTNIQYPFAAVLTLNFGENLQDDPDAIYRVFFTTSISPSGYDFGTKDAILVNKKEGGTMSGTIGGAPSVPLSYDYDGNTQRGNGTASDAPVTAVAIGLATAQYVTATGTIERSVTNSISLVAPLERNYQQ